MTRKAIRFSSVVAGLILVAVFTMLVWGSLSSEDVNAQGTCTLKTIKGTYIFEAQGTISQNEKVVPYAEAGIWTLDGEGNAAGFISIGINGVNEFTKEPFTAEYELVEDADCVFFVTDAFGLEVDLYSTRSGQTITYYSPGFSGTMYRQ